MFDFSFAQFISPVTLLFDAAGIFLIILGGSLAVVEWIKIQTVHLRNLERQKTEVQDLRIHFAQKMVLGLEFFLAGDIIRLIATPTTDVLIQIGAIIVIRTILAYFLSKEIRELKNR